MTVPADHRTQLRGIRRLLRRVLRRRDGRAGDDLRTTDAILKAQQEATLDGILVVDGERRVLSYNRRFLEIWGIPAEVAAFATDEELITYAFDAVADVDAFTRGVEALYGDPTAVRSEERIELKDGRTLSRTSIPVKTSEGGVTGRAWYFHDITEAQRSKRLQAALFRISQLSHESGDLPAFYAAIHQVVGEMMDATNFYIAEYDAERDILTFPYFVDQFDTAPDGRPPGRTLTAYVLRTGKPMLITPERFESLVKRGEVELIGAPSVDWLGVPLRTGELTWGVLSAQSYDERRRYTERDREVLVFVSQHLASAIEQKRKEEALRQSERRYRQMFENTRAVQLVIDPASGEIVDANAAACDFYLYTLDELRSMRIWNINVLGEERVREELRNADSQGQSYFLFRHMRANGEIRDVEVHSGPVEVGGRRLLYSIIHDITERKRTERALQQSEAKFRSIFDHASVGIVQSTRDGQLVTANQTMAKILGYDAVDELLQVDMARDVWLDASEREYLFRKFEPRGYATDVEVRWRRRDGAPIWVQINAHAIRSPSGATYFEGFIYDITNRKQAEDSLAAANSQRKAVLDAATRVSIIATDSRGMITVFNSGAERLLGYSAAEMIGRRSLLDLHDPDQVAARGAELSAELHRPVGGFDVLVQRAAREEVEEREWTYVRASAECRTFLVSVTALRGEEGPITGFLHVGTDITERKRAEEMLRQQSAAMTASMDGIGIVNERLEFTHVNDALAKLYGYTRAPAMLGRTLEELYDGEERVRLAENIIPAVRSRGRWRGEATGKRRDGFSFPQEISLTAIEDGGIVCVVRDITERTYAEEQIKHLAYHDALTGLPNRLLFKDRLTVALSHAQRDNTRAAVLYLDLDRFKIINDSLGHNVGDQLLQAVATRVSSCVRESDTVARQGGDEFTLLLPHLVNSEDAALVAQKILEAVRYPFHIEGREFFTTTSIGISIYPEDGSDATTLIKNADTAMYQAKELGRDNYQLFNAFVNAKALQRIAIEHGLRKALMNEELEIHYQPIFDFRSGRISGMEALLRWDHPEMGPIPPNTFIPIAEATGMMVAIGSWALRTASAQAMAWQRSGFQNLSLAVNLSVTQLQQADLVDRVREILEETGLQPHLLELEITESSAMHSPETIARTLYDLKKLGVRISLDDFGTGHSSLSYLKRFPIDTLKIDQSFVRDINADPDTAAIVMAIIAMAHSLRLKVIAEGVEVSDQAAFLKRHSCDQMQGYLVKAPVPAPEFLDLIDVGSGLKI
ncbi:MAG TPA: EAL domain-containing protein [Thermoanaerobaculia bacterium]|nr:EAL domain-containing protein [Thermoanaerobaculia bacterium]